MATDITPPARWVPRCLECRHPTTRHDAECTVGKALAAELERAEKERREAEAKERNRHLQLWAAIRWPGVVAMVAAERTRRGVVIRAWLVILEGGR
jgi:hypothetical protein